MERDGRQTDEPHQKSREGLIMEDRTSIDHITLCVENLQAAELLFTKVLGFHVIWSAKDVGSDKSSMNTIVVQRGSAKIALMEGHNKLVTSQINEFIKKHGQGVQHFALEVDDIEAVSREWEANGVRFSGPLKEGCDGFGPLKQRFTYPLFPASGLFIELTQRKQGEERAQTFVRETVEALYEDIERHQLAGNECTIIDYERSPISPTTQRCEGDPMRRAL
ncbi:MAG: hypothetical protein D6704_05380 [Nitrospirae bacterium]|nr:MAG: hypothetical protein D6704_05380 [Nitrospirota bacterium]